jgi:glc operon protein GlcG
MQQILKYGPPISIALAKQIASAAEAEAVANGWPVVIAILDPGANLVLLHKLDHTQLGSVAVAQAKAQTAVKFKRPTKSFEEALAAGGGGLKWLAINDLCPVEGGLPLIQNGEVIGAIGVSGVLSNQDAQVAAAGAAVISG